MPPKNKGIRPNNKAFTKGQTKAAKGGGGKRKKRNEMSAAQLASIEAGNNFTIPD